MRIIFFFLSVSMMVSGLYISGKHYYEWEYWALMTTYGLFSVFMRLEEFAQEKE